MKKIGLQKSGGVCQFVFKFINSNNRDAFVFGYIEKVAVSTNNIIGSGIHGAGQKHLIARIIRDGILDIRVAWNNQGILVKKDDELCNIFAGDEIFFPDPGCFKDTFDFGDDWRGYDK